MSVRRISCVALLAALFACLDSGAAHAATCGVVDPQTKTTPRATLTLDDTSVTSIAYKRSTNPKDFLLRFNVAGCEIPADAAAPAVDLTPKQDIAAIGDGVVKFVRHLPDGAVFSVRLKAPPKSFGAGSYGGFVELRAPYMLTTRTPIALSRSTSSQLLPMLLGMLGGIVGVGWFLILNRAKGAKATIQWWHYLVVFLAAAFVGVIVVENAYRAQDVWTFDENWLSAIVAAFTGATTGTMATALAVLFPEPAKDPPAQAGESTAVREAVRATAAR
jgi:hypothetical protein